MSEETQAGRPEWERLGCNPFLIPMGQEAETPNSLYAVLDQADALVDGQRAGLHRLIFAAVNAAWFDARWADDIEPNINVDFLAIYREMPIFLVEVEFGGDAILALARNAASVLTSTDQQASGSDEVPPDVTAALEALESEWMRIEIGTEGAEAALYANLFGELRRVFLSSVSRPSPEIQSRLDQTDPLHDEADATETDIKDALKPITSVASVSHVAVYDVGQGGANGLVSAAGDVLAYFDFGGGATSHKMTFPSALTRFCFCSGAVPIILSHWDHDHWSSEGRDTRSHSQTWIAPRQSGTRTKRGFHHSALIASILSHGKLLLWPQGLTVLSVGQVTLWKCTGTSRNASGLALVVTAPSCSTSDPVLLPADAGYNDLPIGAPAKFDAICAPHHGGRSNSVSIPPARGYRCERLMYSYGHANSYGHAFKTVRTAHDAQGWSDPKVSATHPVKVRNTENRSTATNTGHIGFGWGAGLAPGPPTCAGGCPLGIDQV